MLALVRKLVNGNEDDAADTVEAAFANARASETEPEKYLVDGGWQAPEPEMPGIVELITDSDTENSAMEDTNRDSNVAGAETDVAESPQTLFSCAEFMSEPPANRRGSARNLQPSRSLFEWAVAMEQTHEAEKDEAALPA